MIVDDAELTADSSRTVDLVRSVRLFICPYDVLTGQPGSPTGLVRNCAMRRYIPITPNVDNSDWEEMEILGNHALVKVVAPDTVIATIKADVDCVELPRTIPVPPADQTAINTKLLSLGYTQTEINNAGWTASGLQSLLGSWRSDISPNGTLDGIVLGARVSAPKPVQILHDRIPN